MAVKCFEYLLLACALTSLAYSFPEGTAQDAAEGKEIDATTNKLLRAQVDSILSKNDKIFEFGSFGNKVYFVELYEMDWFDAKDFCESMDLQLVTIDSTAELNYFIATIEGLEERYWTSGYGTEKYTWNIEGPSVTNPIRISHRNCLILADSGLWGDPCIYNEKVVYPMCELKFIP